jgi:hypothetical protein
MSRRRAAAFTGIANGGHKHLAMNFPNWLSSR